MSKQWINEFKPEVIEDTGHYVRLKSPRAMLTLDMAEFCEHLLSLGYRYLAGDANGIVCEKLNRFAGTLPNSVSDQDREKLWIGTEKKDGNHGKTDR